MNRQSHIVSIDDARRTAAGYRFAAAAFPQDDEDEQGVAYARDGVASRGYARARRSVRNAERPRASVRNAERPRASVRNAERPRASVHSIASARGTAADAASSRNTARPPAHSAERPSVRKSSRADARTQARSSSTRELARAHGRGDSQTKLSKNLEKARRTRVKEKAARRYEKLYGAEEQAAASSAYEQVPQPAVYAPKMGRAHRRAVRMQNGISRDVARSAQGSFDEGRARTRRRRHIFTRGRVICLVVVVVVLIGCASLYDPARDYYLQIRERDRVQAEYEAVQERNDALQSQIDALSTDAGIEDAARAEFGWVMEGETAGVVSGLDSSDGSVVSANVMSGSVEAPETWYSRLFGPFFEVEESSG